MKRWATITLLVLVAAGLAGWFVLPREEKTSLMHAPDVTYRLLTGEAQQLSSLKGQRIVLHFWATWCAPCIEEFPSLILLAQQHPDWIFLLVSVDDTRDVIDAFMDNIQRKTLISLGDVPNVRMVWDQDKNLSLAVFQTAIYPETFFIDETFTIKHKIIGPITAQSLPW
ncbi:MAG: TlpA family protein disulfide reductase [Rickettsiales bacterium]|nr:TlpA family protein disulfide reductase [Rickettsiales bacterium]